MGSTKSIFIAHSMNNQHMCDNSNKNFLIWGGSVLYKDVNFPPHQSHAENQLHLSPQAL
jgi:hypothetical protein